MALCVFTFTFRVFRFSFFVSRFSCGVPTGTKGESISTTRLRKAMSKGMLVSFPHVQRWNDPTRKIIQQFSGHLAAIRSRFFLSFTIHILQVRDLYSWLVLY